jgi:hypothetical protein
MNNKEIIIAVVSGVLCMCLGIAVSPKKTGTPLDRFNNYISDFYADDNGKEYIKCGYFQDGDVGQCLLFDKKQGSKLVGVEYVISDYVYKKLPADEQQNWNSLEHHFNEGWLMNPPEIRLSHKYAKTIILWNGELPSHEPLYMWGFSKDYNPSEKIIAERDLQESVSTNEIKRSREWRSTKPYQRKK